MTVNSNMMLVIVLLCVGYLQAASTKPQVEPVVEDVGQSEPDEGFVEPEPEDCYTSKDYTVVNFAPYATPRASESACKDLCQKKDCGVYKFYPKYRYCYIYPKPIIFVEFETSAKNCTELCSEMANCKTTGFFSTGICYLIDVTYNDIDDKMIVKQKISEKTTCE